jgi:hypothetical protein
MDQSLRTLYREDYSDPREMKKQRCRKLYEKLNYFYSLPNIVRVIKSRMMIPWMRHGAHMAELRNAYIIFATNMNG